MSRRREAEKREILPDPEVPQHGPGKVHQHGHAQRQEVHCGKIVYGALDQIGSRKKTDNSLEVFIQALDNVKPVVEVKSRRVGGATYQIPIEVRAERSMTLAMRWLVDAAKKRGEKSMGLRLAGEILDASDNKGTAIKKREDTHKMAEANKAFSHYRW